MAEKRKTAKSRVAAKPIKAKTPEATTAKSELPNSFKLTLQVFSIIKAFWRPLLGIVLVYLVLNVVFASGLSNLSTAVSGIKTNLNNTSSASYPLAKGISGFGALVGSAGVSGSASGSILQSILFVIESLVIIWALRQLLAAKSVTVKEAYYHSTYPLVPFLLVILVIIVQLLPITVGAAVLSAVLTSAASGLSLIVWLSWIIFIALSAWSFYMLSASIFALYIVTLPEMHPREALRSARNLVSRRRWQILPKVLYLPLFVLVAMGIIIIPLIFFASFLVAPVFYILSMLTILFAHAYLYTLYRGLIA
jgi:hypothetical protein